MEFVKASEDDKLSVMKLYKNAIGSPGCTWDENYPSLEHTESDIARDDLFCLKNESGEIIGAISIDDDAQVQELSFWSENGAELARLVVKEEYQNQGIAGLLLKNAMEVLRQRGYAYIHFLVSKEHTKALRAYEKLNFERVGECDLYDGNWWCYEKKL